MLFLVQETESHICGTGIESTGIWRGNHKRDERVVIDSENEFCSNGCEFQDLYKLRHNLRTVLGQKHCPSAVLKICVKEYCVIIYSKSFLNAGVAVYLPTSFNSISVHVANMLLRVRHIEYVRYFGSSREYPTSLVHGTELLMAFCDLVGVISRRC